MYPAAPGDAPASRFSNSPGAVGGLKAAVQASEQEERQEDFSWGRHRVGDASTLRRGRFSER